MNRNPLTGGLAGNIRNIFSQQPRQLSGTRSGTANPFAGLAQSVAGQLSGGANPAQQNPFQGAPSGVGTLGQATMGGAPTTGNTGGLAKASDIGPYGSGTGDPWTDSYVYGGVVMDGSAPSAEAYNRYGPGAGMSSIYPAGASSMSQGQYNYWQDRYVNDWASNGILDAEKEGAYGQDAFAWNVAYDKVAQERGYPPGSFGMVTRSRGNEWISPDGLGPNGEPAHFVSYNGGLTPGFSNPDADMDAATFLAAHPDWVAAAAADPSIFNAADAAIWQHTDMGTMQAAIALMNAGGGGPGAAGTPVPGDTGQYITQPALQKNPPANSAGNRNASGGKPGDHKNTGSGGGRDTKGGGGGGNKGGGGGNKGGGGHGGGGGKNNTKKR